MYTFNTLWIRPFQHRCRLFRCNSLGSWTFLDSDNFRTIFCIRRHTFRPYAMVWQAHKLGCSHHCHKSVCLSVCMYVCPAVHEVLFLRNYFTKSFQNWQADALGHPDVPFSKWSWSDWHCGHKSQIVMTTNGYIHMLEPVLTVACSTRTFTNTAYPSMSLDILYWNL